MQSNYWGEDDMPKSSDVILVHGAWADGSSWAKVIPLLAARGHSVTAVQLSLTSLGDDTAESYLKLTQSGVSDSFA
jgi:pimeloyl-ACP methyl ester carboxylesterase